MRNSAKNIITIALVVFGAVLLSLGAAVSSLRLTPARYEARAIIWIDKDPTGSSTTNSTYYDPYFYQTEFEVIQSEIILDQVITNLDLNRVWTAKLKSGAPLKTSESRALLKQAIHFAVQPRTNLFEITVRGDERVEAANIANAIADAYVDFRERQWRERDSAVTNAVQAQLAQMDANIAAARELVAQLKTNLVMEQSQNKPATNLTPANLDYYHNLAIDNQTQLVREQKTLSDLKALNRQQLRNALPTVAPDPILNALLQNLNSNELASGALKLEHGEAHPEVVRINSAITDLNRRIEERMDGILAGMQLHLAALTAVVTNSEQKVEASRRREREKYEKQRPYNEAMQKVRDLESARESMKRELEKPGSVARQKVTGIVSRAIPPAQALPPNPQFIFALLGSGAGLELLGLLLLIRGRQAKLPPAA